MPTDLSKCPFCETATKSSTDNRDYWNVECPNCGSYQIACYYYHTNPMQHLSPLERAIISTYIWENQNNNRLPIIDKDTMDLPKTKSLPNPAEKLDKLIFYLVV